MWGIGTSGIKEFLWVHGTVCSVFDVGIGLLVPKNIHSGPSSARYRRIRTCILECHPLYHLPATTSYHYHLKGKTNLFLEFQCVVSFGRSFEISNKHVGNKLNWVTQKSLAWLDLGFRESIEEVVIEVNISVMLSIHRTNTAKKQISHFKRWLTS